MTKPKIFKTTVLGIGPWCVEFPDGEIIHTRTEARAEMIAKADSARQEERERCAKAIMTDKARHKVAPGSVVRCVEIIRELKDSE